MTEREELAKLRHRIVNIIVDCPDIRKEPDGGSSCPEGDDGEVIDCEWCKTNAIIDALQPYLDQQIKEAKRATIQNMGSEMQKAMIIAVNAAIEAVMTNIKGELK